MRKVRRQEEIEVAGDKSIGIGIEMPSGDETKAELNCDTSAVPPTSDTEAETNRAEPRDAAEESHEYRGGTGEMPAGSRLLASILSVLKTPSLPDSLPIYPILNPPEFHSTGKRLYEYAAVTGVGAAVIRLLALTPPPFIPEMLRWESSAGTEWGEYWYWQLPLLLILPSVSAWTSIGIAKRMDGRAAVMSGLLALLTALAMLCLHARADTGAIGLWLSVPASLLILGLGQGWWQLGERRKEAALATMTAGIWMALGGVMTYWWPGF